MQGITLQVIRSFRSKGLKLFASKGDSSKLSVPNDRRVRRILDLLEQAVSPEEMNIPGFTFHKLLGDAAGRYAVDASGNYRVTFGWEGTDALGVDLEDYH